MSVTLLEPANLEAHSLLQEIVKQLSKNPNVERHWAIVGREYPETVLTAALELVAESFIVGDGGDWQTANRREVYVRRMRAWVNFAITPDINGALSLATQSLAAEAFGVITPDKRRADIQLACGDQGQFETAVMNILDPVARALQVDSDGRVADGLPALVVADVHGEYGNHPSLTRARSARDLGQTSPSTTPASRVRKVQFPEGLLREMGKRLLNSRADVVVGAAG